MNKFMIGDKVKFKGGGPILVVQVVPIQPIQPQNPLPGVAVVVFNNVAHQHRSYNCVWWNEGLNMFSSCTLHEDMLEDYKE